MAEIVKTDHDNLNATITVTITPEDYQSKVDTELANYRKKAQLKGFRKGKTPLNTIRKMYGKAILADAINELLQDKMGKYLNEFKGNIIGSPLPSDEQGEIEFNINEKKDYVFAFDIGTAPDVQLNGLNSDGKFDLYEVTIPKEEVDKTLEDVRKKAGDRASVDDAIIANDIIAINAEELAGEKAKENGWACTFNILVDDITEEYRDQFLGKKKEDKVTFDIYNLETGKDEEFVKKYILQIQDNDENPEVGRMFEGTIADVSRIQTAEMDQAFFDKVFGEGKIKSETEARDFITEEMGKQYIASTNGILFQEVQERLIEDNKIDLPEAFLRKLIKNNNPEVQDEEINKDFEKVKDNLRWNLIKNKIQEKFDIEVKEEELLEGFKDQIRGYFGGYGDELIVLNTANRMMEDRQQANQMYERLLSEKVFESIKEQITLNKISITKEELEEKVKALNEKMNPTVEAAEEIGTIEAPVDATAENE